MVTVTSQLNIKPLERLGELFVREASRVIRSTAFLIEGDAKIESPVDTGANRAGIYTVTENDSGYNKAIGEALGLYQQGNPNAKAEEAVAPEVPPTGSAMSAVVAASMAYSAELEFGSPVMPARPYLIPAAKGRHQYYLDGMKQALRNAAKNAGWNG